MLQAGYLATYATDWLGAANVRTFKIRFRAPVWPQGCDKVVIGVSAGVAGW
jgi:hypothetical protein